MEKFILTSNVDAYNALLDAGFAGLGLISRSGPLYAVFNSESVELPEDCKQYLIFSDQMFFA